MVLVSRQTRALLRREGLVHLMRTLTEVPGVDRATEVVIRQLLPDPTREDPQEVASYLRARLDRLLAFLIERGVTISQAPTLDSDQRF